MKKIISVVFGVTFAMGLVSIAVPSDSRAEDLVTVCISNGSGDHQVDIATAAAEKLLDHGLAVMGPCTSGAN